MNDKPPLSIIHFRKDAYIVVEGKRNANAFFIIREGMIKIAKNVTVADEESSSILHPGDFFAVVSTMSAHSYIETAQALSDATLISVPRDGYQQLIEKNPSVAMKIIESFSRRMRHLDEALARFTAKESVESSMEHLYDMGVYYASQQQNMQAYYTFCQYIEHFPNGKWLQQARQAIEDLQSVAQLVSMEEDHHEFIRFYSKDTMIFAETMSGQELYIIQKGSVKITKFVNKSEVLLAVLKQGDIFGEMSLIENKPRSASAIAFEDAVLLAVNKINFTRMVVTQPQIIARLTRLFAERIWLIYKQLANTRLSDNVGRLYDALLIQLEKERIPLRYGQSYQFNFGARELIDMVGLASEVGSIALRKLFTNNCIKIIDNRIHVADVEEIVKQSEYYHKMRDIQQAREQSRRSAP